MKKLRDEKTKKQAEKKKREEIINSGDAREIDKIKGQMTDEEYERALSRVKMNASLQEYKTAANRAKLEDISNKVSTIANTAGRIAEAAEKGVRVYEGLQKVGIIKKKESQMDKLKKLETLTSIRANIAKNENIIANGGVLNKGKKGNNNGDDDGGGGGGKKKQKKNKEQNSIDTTPQETKSFDKVDKDIQKKKNKNAKEEKKVYDAERYINNGMSPKIKDARKRTEMEIKVFKKQNPDVDTDIPRSGWVTDFNEWKKKKGLNHSGIIVRRLPDWVENDDDLELYHHGIKGQKWGVRRYQNADGSLTDAGKKHYGTSNTVKKTAIYGTIAGAAGYGALAAIAAASGGFASPAIAAAVIANYVANGAAYGMTMGAVGGVGLAAGRQYVAKKNGIKLPDNELRSPSKVNKEFDKKYNLKDQETEFNKKHNIKSFDEDAWDKKYLKNR